MKTTAIFVCSLIFAGSLAEAQVVKDRLRKLNVFREMPEVTVTVEHPPRLGLEVDSVVFAPPEGDCGEEFVDRLISDFVNNGVEVVDRANLGTLLTEHEFSVSGVVDPEDALELGKISGADALVITKIRHCGIEKPRMEEKRYKNKDGSYTVHYEATTRAHLRGSLQVVNLLTAKVYSSQPVDKTTSLTAEATNSRPSYPSDQTVLSNVLTSAASDIHKLFFPWWSTRTLKYYDENQCGMRIAYRLMQAGEVMSALEQARDSVEMCEYQRVKKPKLVAKALYNLGVTQMLLERFGEASETLEESLRLDPNKATSQAMAEVRRVASTAEAVEQAEASGLMRPGTGDGDSQSLTEDEADDAVLEAELAKLKRLYDKGLISKEVYDERVAALLDG